MSKARFRKISKYITIKTQNFFIAVDLESC